MKTGAMVKQFIAKDGRQIVLRTPKWEDLDDLNEVINSLVEEGSDITRDKKVTREEEAAWLGRVLADLENDKTFYLVAEVEGKVIANSEVSRHSGYSSHVGMVGIAIRDGYRDVGIGTEMIQTLIAQAEKMGLKMLLLDVFASNERAVHVYEKVGFKETGRKPKFFYRNGKYIDDILMARET